jgi:hypothetical protein
MQDRRSAKTQKPPEGGFCIAPDPKNYWRAATCELLAYLYSTCGSHKPMPGKMYSKASANT